MINIFISYAADDNAGKHITEFGQQLRAEFKTINEQAEVFLFEADYDPADFRERILPKLQHSHFLIVFLSKRYLAHPNAYSEYEIFLNREKELGRSRNRIIIIQSIESVDFNDASYSSWIIDDLKHRNSKDWTCNRLNGPQDPHYKKDIHEIVTSIVKINQTKASPSSLLATGEQSLPSTRSEAIDHQLVRLANAIVDSPIHIRFRNDMIAAILGDVISEIGKLNEKNYKHDISLNTSFMLRAASIFHAASEVYAVSVDSYSSFWLAAGAVRDRAEAYTALQPRATYRMFVFSSAESLLAHRWVLAEHHRQYGEEGRVMFTSRSAWSQFLAQLSEKESKDTLQRRFGSDFAILQYNPYLDTYYEALLNHETLSFHSIDRLSEAQKEIMSAFKGTATDSTIKLKGGGTAYIWCGDFGSEQHGDRKSDRDWYEAVYALFDSIDVGEKPTTSLVAHIVLFSSELQRKGVFERRMQEQIPHLRGILGSSGQRLVQSIWFGKIADIGSRILPLDALHQQRLVVENSFTEHWPFALIAYFASEDDLKQYYEHRAHAEVRREIYGLFSADLRELYEELQNPDTRPEKRAILATALEQAALRYMRRMDFGMLDPYSQFQFVDAPSFGHSGA